MTVEETITREYRSVVDGKEVAYSISTLSSGTKLKTCKIERHTSGRGTEILFPKFVEELVVLRDLLNEVLGDER